MIAETASIYRYAVDHDRKSVAGEQLSSLCGGVAWDMGCALVLLGLLPSEVSRAFFKALPRGQPKLHGATDQHSRPPRWISLDFLASAFTLFLQILSSLNMQFVYARLYRSFGKCLSPFYNSSPYLFRRHPNMTDKNQDPVSSSLLSLGILKLTITPPRRPHPHQSSLQWQRHLNESSLKRSVSAVFVSERKGFSLRL
jgi:hypothetical protein